MSSLINDVSSSSAGMPEDPNSNDRIIHFDATQRRKDKMRQMAAGDKSGAAPVEAVVAPPATPAPTPVHSGTANGQVAPIAATPPPASPVATPAPAPVAEAPASTSGSMSGKELEAFLINFVVEQTGYPEEMVELDVDLEADLGIDSIKKAQLFGELSEFFEVTVTEDLSLDNFPTLQHVADFLATVPQKGAAPVASTPAPVAAAPAAVSPAPAPAAVAPAAVSPAPAPVAEAPASTSGSMSGKELEAFLINFVVEQTGYPEEMVELDVDLEADLGIDSIKKAQLFGELSEFFEVTVTEDLSLDNFPTLQHVADFLATVPQKGAAPVASTPAPVAAAPAAVSPAPAPAAVAPAAVSPAPAPVAEAPASTSGSMSGKELEAFLINFVVEQTGYPEEMVELDVDLEADLGIDSIKKAQLFGELSEFFEVTVTEDLSLDNFPTLQHVADFLATVPQKGAAPVASTPAPVAAAPAAVSPAPAPVVEAAADSNGMSDDQLESFLINFVVEQTGYPEEMVELDVDLEADLGIDSIKKAQLFGELSEFFEVTVSEDLSLDNFPTLRHVKDFLKDKPRR